MSCSACCTAYAPSPCARSNGATASRAARSASSASTPVAAFGDGGQDGSENPYTLHQELQQTMNDLVGIIRKEEEIQEALDKLEGLKARAEKVGVHGNREYNPGWHTALDLRNLLTVSEAIARAALERRESRGGHFRDDFPAKDPAYGTFNVVVRRAPDGEMQVERRPIPAMPEELKAIVTEMG